MGLKIIISSAVKSKEKECVKEKLKEMRAQHIINFDDDDLYDCNEHAIYWDKVSNQEIIDGYIKTVDWFICLIPEDTVGKETWNELEERLKAKRDGSPVIISVFHPEIPDDRKQESVSKDSYTYKFITSEADKILGNTKKQYEVRYNYGDYDNLKWHIEDQYDKLYNIDKVFWSQHIGYFTKKGVEVEASKLFFDSNRASQEWGFKEGHENYIWRQSVDGKLDQKLEDTDIKFLFVTGKPTSGKSRAILECLHSTLKKKNVVVMKSDNIMAICQAMQIEIQQQSKYNGLPNRFKDNNYIFVCDQINDVFKQARVPEELRLSFFRIISENNNCKLLATGTWNSLDNFVSDSKGIISPLEKVYEEGNSSIITIPSISKDIDSLDIIAFLRQKYAVTDGETIGDFIHELNIKKQEIVRDIYEEAHQNPYLPKLLRAFQLTLVYRNITPLLLPITILRSCYSKADPSEFKERTIDSLNFLIRKNVIKISDTEFEEKEIFKFPENVFSESRYCITTLVEDEEYYKLIPESYTFTVNELVWDYLIDLSQNNEEAAILYNLYKKEDLDGAMSLLFESYPHAPTLRRLVSRVPMRTEWQDKQENTARLRMAWNFSRNMLKELCISEESVEELTKLQNILIGRAQLVEEIDSVLEIMSKYNIEIDAATIGEMYKFAYQNFCKGTNDFMDYIKKIDKLNEEQQKRDRLRGRGWTYTDLYKVKWQITLFSGNYNEAFNLVFKVLDNITHIDQNGNQLKGKEAINYICSQTNTLEKKNLDLLIGQLAKLCRNEKEINQLIKCHQYYHIMFTPLVLHCIGNVLKNVSNMERIIDTILPTSKAKNNNSQLYESMVAYFVTYLSTFADSIKLYDKWYNDLKEANNHNMRLVSLCLRNCQREEFQSALRFVNRMPKSRVNGIILNLLVSVAPNPEEALNLVNSMKPSDIDEYTLSNCLRCIDTVKQMNTRSEGAKIPTEQFFIMAYEIINHPKLKTLRTRPRCLQKIFRLVTFREQEHYVINISEKKQNELDNNIYICSTRISYRSFSEAWEDIYQKVGKKFIEKQGTFIPDLFNAMCAKYYKDRYLNSHDKADYYAEELKTDIQHIENSSRGGKMIRDEFFFLNYYVKFQGVPLFTSNGMSPVFMEWFEGKIGNYNPFNLNILPRYMDYILNQKGIAAEKKWLQALTIYNIYVQLFETYKRAFTPDNLVYLTMFKIVEKCNNRTNCLEFIDKELEKWNIKRDLRLNKYLQEYESEFHFMYNISHPQPLNRQKDNLDTIKNSTQTEQVMAVLEQEIALEGFVSSSVINRALSQYIDFQNTHRDTVSFFLNTAKNKLPKDARFFNLSYLVKSCFKNLNKQSGERLKMALIIQKHYAKAKTWGQLRKELDTLCKQLDREQYEEIVHFIKYHHLVEKLTLRGIAYLALLAKDIKERSKWLEKLEKSEEINENIFGIIATDPEIAQTDMSISRKYFTKWLAIYQDIYGDTSIIIKFLHETRWNTLGRHLKYEIAELAYLRKTAEMTSPKQLPDFYAFLLKEGKTAALDTIIMIMRFYEFCPQYNMSLNYTELLSFDDVIDLLSAYTGNSDYWESISMPITK